MKLKVVIACGGTGGHLFPGIAVAQELGRRGHETLLLISEKEVDAVAAKDHPELRFEKVPAIGMPKLLSPKIVPFALKFWRTLAATKKIVRGFGADVVLGMGGFTSLPPAMAGRKLGASTFIHESNAIPGKANRLTARFCDGVLLGLEACAKHFPGKDCRVVGTPLRESMRERKSRAEALAYFGLDEGKRTLLVMGGSQGARGVNRGVMAVLPKLDAATTQLVWLSGRDDEAEVRAAVAGSAVKSFVAPFSGRLDLAYAISDLCIARSGASSLAELSHFGIASILIPLPTAADDHQTRNAEVFSQKDAAILLRQDAAATDLAPLIEQLLRGDARRGALAAKIQAMDVPDAAARVADVLETSRGKRDGGADVF